ncbi:ABC transporter ATP-binding protein [Pelagibacterium sediminicola]|uniref:ABC transporter ATP-binding protein n=1 Tax=Pelagibacterium sediminicola TaxID=2248761 RepID=UPI000E310FE7|nr:ABC transporter ATP-binding protein [Pelagibacterium sediminicola]
MSLLRVKDLSLSIGPTPILDRVSLEAGRGEILGIVGESGSGKSLTALSILNLLPRHSRLSGSVIFDDIKLTRLSDRALNDVRGDDIGMIFQEPMTALNPVKTIGAQVAETVLVHGKAGRGEAMAIARQTLDRVGLGAEEFPLSRYPHELSGGQRQRVGIAMAIALRPRLLIADEPTTALDVTNQAQVLDLLKDLVREDGMGLILITHDLAVVAEMADTVAVLKAGRVVESGPVRDVFRQMRDPYTRKLFSASAHVPARKAQQSARTLLEVEGLVRTYPKPKPAPWAPRAFKVALDGVSLSVAQGESVGLVGESGSGKSTLARAVLGLETAQAGEIAINGAPVRGPGDTAFATRRAMQMVFQDPYGSFNPRHTVERLVAEPLHLLGTEAPSGAERRRRIDTVLTQVGLLPADANKFIHEFSGGQRQRIAIARALIVEPSLIVLDEAVSALDVSIRAQILDLLAAISERIGVAYLFISHDLHVVRAVTDRVYVLKDGKVVESGATSEVFERPRHDYTRALIAAAPRLDAALKTRFGE